MKSALAPFALSQSAIAFVYRARVPEVLCAGQDQEVMGSPLVLFTLGRTLLK